MSNLDERADDYERRLARAGSTENIIKSLVQGAASNKRTVRTLTVSLILNIILSLAMAGLAVVAWSNATRIENNAVLISRNAGLLANDVYRQCIVDKQITKEITVVYETLIRAVELTDSLPPAEKRDRIKKYNDAKPDDFTCTRPVTS